MRAMTLCTFPILPLSRPRMMTTRSSLTMWKYFASSTTMGYSGSPPRFNDSSYRRFCMDTGISGLLICCPVRAPYLSASGPYARFGRRGPSRQSSLTFALTLARTLSTLSRCHVARCWTACLVSQRSRSLSRRFARSRSLHNMAPLTLRISFSRLASRTALRPGRTARGLMVGGGWSGGGEVRCAGYRAMCMRVRGAGES